MKPNNKGFKTIALLDTGAGLNLFKTDYADMLGLNWQAAPTVPVTGISGTVDAHVLPVRIEIVDAHYSWTADIAFCPGMTSALPLLGHDGFFEHFEVRFKTSAKQYRIHLK